MNRHLLTAVLALLCTGCVNSRLESRRQTLALTSQDTTRPLSERVLAFDDLLATFTSGTREATLDRFLGPAAIIKTRFDSTILDDGTLIPGHHFNLLLRAPDGSDRMLTLKKDKVL
jgi:hypothetical protein